MHQKLLTQYQYNSDHYGIPIVNTQASITTLDHVVLVADIVDEGIFDRSAFARLILHVVKLMWGNYTQILFPR